MREMQMLHARGVEEQDNDTMSLPGLDVGEEMTGGRRNNSLACELEQTLRPAIATLRQTDSQRSNCVAKYTM